MPVVMVSTLTERGAEVTMRALELGATALILVHNHPSGDPTPSRADVEMTAEVKAAAGGAAVVGAEAAAGERRVAATPESVRDLTMGTPGYRAIHRSILAGLLGNIATRQDDGTYQAILDKYGVTGGAIPTSEINPTG